MPKATLVSPKGTVKALATKKPETEEAKYSTIGAELFGVGDTSEMTADDAKDLLGWSEVVDSNYTLIDNNGKKVRCANNWKNRPYYPANAQLVKQEILRRRWQLNGESMIIGASGLVLSCQHRLIGLVLAVQEWEQHPDQYPEWETAPTISCLLITGIDESDTVVNTIDTGKPRTLADVLYRSEYFSSYKDKDRQAIARICQYAVKTAWHRTGVEQAYSIRATHAESLNFIATHPKILECVRHIYEEDQPDDKGNRPITRWLPTGTAAGMLYLMGCCKTDPDLYHREGTPTEVVLDWELWDRACEFWVLLAGGEKQFVNVRHTLADLGDGGTRAEKLAVIVHAWNSYAVEESMTPSKLRLEYTEDEEGAKHLAECPTVGGIDLGNPKDPIVEGVEEPEEDEETEEEEPEEVAPIKAPRKKAAAKK